MDATTGRGAAIRMGKVRTDSGCSIDTSVVLTDIQSELYKAHIVEPSPYRFGSMRTRPSVPSAALLPGGTATTRPSRPSLDV